MGKTVAIVQSSYIPWRGYFDLIDRVDEFILLDDVQYTRRDWRNRNRIKTSSGTAWLTIPVKAKGRYLQKICETRIDDPDWARKHWTTITTWYRKTPYFKHYSDFLEELYSGCGEEFLSLINHRFLRAICPLLEISTELTWSMDYSAPEERTDRLLALCQAAQADTYISGPTAKRYLDVGKFNAAGIEVLWMDYSGYRPYQQLFPPFRQDVSIIDLLLNAGPDARKLLGVVVPNRPAGPGED